MASEESVQGLGWWQILMISPLYKVDVFNNGETEKWTPTSLDRMRPVKSHSFVLYVEGSEPRAGNHEHVIEKVNSGY